MPKISQLTIAVLAAMTLPGAAFAGFVDETAAPKAAAPSSTAAPAAVPAAAPAPAPEIPVRLEGDAPSVLLPSKGMGRRLPLAAALTAFVPPGYRVTYTDQVDTGTLVDWTGRPAWITTLTEVVGSAGVVAVINWQRKTVAVKNSFTEVEKLPTWTLKAGDRVSTRFDDWSRQNGWQLAWEVKELVIEGVDMTTTGNFMDAIGSFVEAMNQGGAEIRVRFYMDNNPPVLRVTERTR